MPTLRKPRYGSLQIWPRKRINKFLPSVNWDAINSGKNIKGFIGYKVGMKSAYVKDNTPNSMTKGKKIAIPVTVIECPSMKIFSVRFYKNGKVMTELVSENAEKELKKVLKLPKAKTRKIEEVKDYDNIRVIVYSEVKKTNIKKTPDIVEIGLNGSVEDKLKFVKENLNKEINVSDIFDKNQLVDIHGLTTGKGLQGPVKRFGISLKAHKSEKGVRRPGSLGPWRPRRVTFRVPMAGQMGMFTRTVYNSKLIELGKTNDKFKGFKNFGDIKTEYIIVNGSVQGPSKRQLILTYPLRKNKKQEKKDFELLDLR
ncbi:MAG: 50S ribosomal protein L3 [archaeon]|nr:50S ribosomal protein L3 [archaeon]